MKHLLEYHLYSLNEGGKALPGVKRVTQEEVARTIDNMEAKLFPLLGIQLPTKGYEKANSIILGSALHKETSGDIDIGTEVSLAKINATVKDSGMVSGENWMQGLQVLSIAYPIAGDEENGYVQVDFIPMKNKAWTEFVYKFPEGSKYKSAVRNWLLAAICSVIREGVEYGQDGSTPIAWDGYMFKLNDGLYKIHKTFLGRKGVLKQGKNEYDGLVTIDPEEFVHILFGDEYGTKDVETTEQVLDIIKNKDFKYHGQADKILEEFKRFLNRAKLDVPKEA